MHFVKQLTTRPGAVRELCALHSQNNDGLDVYEKFHIRGPFICLWRPSKPRKQLSKRLSLRAPEHVNSIIYAAKSK